nr:hypothetical protein [Actinomadura graeca]
MPQSERLGQPDGGTPADRDETVRPGVGREPGRPVHRLGRDVPAGPAERSGREVAQQVPGPPGEGRLPRRGEDHRPADAETADLLPEAAHRAGAERHAHRQRLVGEPAGHGVAAASARRRSKRA